MIKQFLTAAAVCAVLTGGAARAATYDFTYTFSDGQEVTGSFNGVSTDGGLAVTDISNIQVALNGIAFAPVVVSGQTLGNATLQSNTWNTSTEAFDNTTPVTVFFNGALNNFVLSDVDASTNTSPDYEFAYINDPAAAGVVAANFLQTDSYSQGSTQLALDAAPNSASWSLTPVPVPAPVLLLGSGLALFGVISRRRQAV
jgi:hypothetical protein